MDLLLHLVRHHEVPVAQVDMGRVCEQYLAIVLNAENLDLETAAEYLVIASTLVAIKSQSLLPAAKPLEEMIAEMPGGEFYEELRRRLVEYELTKERAVALTSRPQLGHEVFVRKDHKALAVNPEELEPDDDAFSLGSMFAKLLKRIGETGRRIRILLEPVSVTQFMVNVLDHLNNDRSSVANTEPVKKSFREIVRVFFCAKKSAPSSNKNDSDKLAGGRGTVIGSFVAILELMKRGLVRAEQPETNGEISIELRMRAEGTGLELGNLSSEFDAPDTGNENESRVVNLAEFRAAHDKVESINQSSVSNEQEWLEVNRG